MSDVTETIARAIANNVFEQGYGESRDMPIEWDWIDQGAVNFALSANAVIAALEAAGYAIVPCEPSEAMWDAAMREGYDQDPATYYRAMISIGKAKA